MIPPWLPCREFVKFLDDYLAETLPPEKREEFLYHLSACPPCVSYMTSYAAAVRMGQAVLTSTDEPVPEDVPEGLIQAILAARKKDS